MRKVILYCPKRAHSSSFQYWLVHCHGVLCDLSAGENDLQRNWILCAVLYRTGTTIWYGVSIYRIRLRETLMSQRYCSVCSLYYNYVDGSEMHRSFLSCPQKRNDDDNISISSRVKKWGAWTIVLLRKGSGMSSCKRFINFADKWNEMMMYKTSPIDILLYNLYVHLFYFTRVAKSIILPACIKLD